ncbi:MAG: hypothetical protein GF313_00655 [Caldithrix sp.]|nr:hypothetical protein [Caldithrix sp.]
MGLMIRVLALHVLFTGLLFGQGKIYEGPNDPAGDKAAEREGYMNGNRVFLYFQNTTELSKWVPNVGAPLWSKWPNGPDGVRMLDGVGLLIGARVYMRNDTIPVEDPETYAGPMDTLYYLQTSYREEMDVDPTGTVEWGIYPVFGYFNEASEHPAMSNRPNSWPTAGWPSSGDGLKWPGEWNGRFGRGVIYADLETYFVANDAQDQEYLGPEDRVKYYPRPGVKIGDIRPEVTIQRGKPWGGIGVRVSQRGFQWNNPQAQDAIFWEYTIANISEYTLPEVAFGYWVDNGIGGEADDEIGFFDTKVDMAYSWDDDGVGRAGLPTGVMGFAYLESPGLPFDGVDNDEDGLVDEKRDNRAMEKIGPTEGIEDLQKFLDFYNLSMEDLKEHWDADEDQDWEDGIDTNGDGIYQINEFPGDDVGIDGVGPGELNYTGPDPDGSEGNHRPDFVEGVGCEPNFNATDVSESDMVGLTSFRLFPVPSHASSYRWFRGDRSLWEVIGSDSLLEYYGNISNLIETFASGPFPLFKGREERISMSELHAYDPLSGLQSEEHSAPALFEQKRIVQVIYEKDYRFAQPPKMPTLQATAENGKVILTWDDIADTRTRDPFVGNVNDFEGYKLYRATDKYLSDARIITDGFGDKKFLKPIFQCDLKDDRQGFTNFGLVNGMGYYLGRETGIVHHFVDSTVQNGRTYYYALVAYDYGAEDIGPGISPSENKVTIDITPETGEVRSYGPNVAIVVPRQRAAGYVPPSVDNQDEEGILGTGSIEAQIIANNSLEPGSEYKVKFSIDTLESVNDYDHGLLYTTNGLTVYNETNGGQMVYSESPDNFTFNNLVYDDTLDYWTFRTGESISTDVFEGLRLKINIPVETAVYDGQRSDWLKGDAEMKIIQSKEESVYFPWDYEIMFTDEDSAYSTQLTVKRGVRDENGSRIDRTRLLSDTPFRFYVLNKSFTDSSGAYEKLDLIVHDQNGNGQFEILEDRVLAGPLTNGGRWAGTAFILDFTSIEDSTALPQAGDVYRMFYKRPFFRTDSISFTVQPEGQLNETEIKNSMDDIKVVPNPYVATNALESAVPNPFLNQPRRLMFTHVPAHCMIKIFTVSGVLVDEFEVNNSKDKGIAYWDLLSRENLDIAAGIYIYHIKALETGDETMGKFAIIK